MNIILKKGRPVQVWIASCLLSACTLSFAAQEIPQRQIDSLREELQTLGEAESSVEMRRQYKKIIRGVEMMVERHPEASERFELIGLAYEAHKVMYTIRQLDDYRAGIMETARALLEAPAEYALLRVEPDMMNTQSEMSGKEIKPQEAAMKLAEFADRYRSTPAESQSLMMAASVAFDQGQQDLLKAFREALTSRFMDDPIVMAFMRERFATASTIHFCGEYERADRTKVNFPIGRSYIMVFWSRESQLLEKKMAEIKALQTRFRGALTVYSFNLDELPDSAAGLLKRKEIDWVPMRLKDGVENPLYLPVANVSRFTALAVGPYGLAKSATQKRNVTTISKTYEGTQTYSWRHLALLRSLCVGDYLLGEGGATPAGFQEKNWSRIDDCVPTAPDRYRLSPENELVAYQQMGQLCADEIEKHTGEGPLYLLRNRRILGLLGEWRLSGDAGLLDAALKEAEASLKLNPPVAERVLPQYAIATAALMKDPSGVERVLKTFIRALGESDAPARAHAAAMMLSLEAHSRDSYERHRKVLLTRFSDDESVSSVTAFLLSEEIEKNLLEQALPGEHSREGSALAVKRKFDAVWDTMDGQKWDGATRAPDAMKAIVFMEPVKDKVARAMQESFMTSLEGIVKVRPRDEFDVTLVFRASDTNYVHGLTKGSESYSIVNLDNTAWASASYRFGLFSTDLIPNLFLLAPDAQIVEPLSGLVALEPRSRKNVLVQKLQVSLNAHDLDLARTALAEKNYKDYAQRLELSFPLPFVRRARRSRSSQVEAPHRRKLAWAYMQIEEWQKAYDALGKNIDGIRQLDQHKTKNFYYAKRPYCEPCHGYLKTTIGRSILLEKLGRTEELAVVTEMIAAAPTCPSGKSVDDYRKYVISENERREANPRWAWVKNAEKYLDYLGRNTRAASQKLFDFGIEHDHLMRALVNEKLGNVEAAKNDRLTAQAQSWPFEMRAFDPELLHEAVLRRSRLARKRAEAGKWEEALALINTNVEIHESEPTRCKSECEICGAQEQSFEYRARTLREFGNKDETAVALEMAKLTHCPPGTKLERHQNFPINRMYGGGNGIRRLNFIENVMRGLNYANRENRELRMEFAADLSLRAEALKNLGRHEEAETNRSRAAALAYPLGADAAAVPGGYSASYTDVVAEGVY